MGWKLKNWWEATWRSWPFIVAILLVVTFVDPVRWALWQAIYWIIWRLLEDVACYSAGWCYY